MDKLRISVAIATYNGAEHITAQLDSIMRQTRAVDEVVMTDDGSTDGTVELVQGFIDAYGLAPQWRIERNEHNLGFGENFRRATDLTTGDLIIFSDQDDIWMIDRVERMADAMQAMPAVGMLTTDFVPLGEDAALEEGKYVGGPKKIKFNKHTSFLRSLGSLMCIRRDYYESVRELWYKGWAHDEFIWRIAVIDGRAYHMDYTSVKRRFHAAQVSGHMGHAIGKRVKYLESNVKSSECLYDYARKLGNKKLIRYFKRSVAAHKMRLALVSEKRKFNALKLLFYLDCYYSVKSYPVELKMAFSRKQK